MQCSDGPRSSHTSGNGLGIFMFRPISRYKFSACCPHITTLEMRIQGMYTCVPVLESMRDRQTTTTTKTNKHETPEQREKSKSRRRRREGGRQIIIHRFYTALFSALGQTHCAHVACDSERVTVSFYSAHF